MAIARGPESKSVFRDDEIIMMAKNDSCSSLR